MDLAATLSFKKRKRVRNVLTRMQDELQTGPFSILYRSINEHLRVRVWTRSYNHVRGVCTGYVIAYDKHWNLAMCDVDEVYRNPRCSLSKKKKRRRGKKKNKIMVIDENKEASMEDKISLLSDTVGNKLKTEPMFTESSEKYPEEAIPELDRSKRDTPISQQNIENSDLIMPKKDLMQAETEIKKIDRSEKRTQMTSSSDKQKFIQIETENKKGAAEVTTTFQELDMTQGSELDNRLLFPDLHTDASLTGKAHNASDNAVATEEHMSSEFDKVDLDLFDIGGPSDIQLEKSDMDSSNKELVEISQDNDNDDGLYSFDFEEINQPIEMETKSHEGIIDIDEFNLDFAEQDKNPDELTDDSQGYSTEDTDDFMSNFDDIGNISESDDVATLQEKLEKLKKLLEALSDTESEISSGTEDSEESEEESGQNTTLEKTPESNADKFPDSKAEEHNLSEEQKSGTEDSEESEDESGQNTTLEKTPESSANKLPDSKAEEHNLSSSDSCANNVEDFGGQPSVSKSDRSSGNEDNGEDNPIHKNSKSKHESITLEVLKNEENKISEHSRNESYSSRMSESESAAHSEKDDPLSSSDESAVQSEAAATEESIQKEIPEDFMNDEYLDKTTDVGQLASSDVSGNVTILEIDLAMESSDSSKDSLSERPVDNANLDKKGMTVLENSDQLKQDISGNDPVTACQGDTDVELQSDKCEASPEHMDTGGNSEEDNIMLEESMEICRVKDKDHMESHPAMSISIEVELDPEVCSLDLNNSIEEDSMVNQSRKSSVVNVQNLDDSVLESVEKRHDPAEEILSDHSSNYESGEIVSSHSETEMPILGVTSNNTVNEPEINTEAEDFKTDNNECQKSVASEAELETSSELNKSLENTIEICIGNSDSDGEIQEEEIAKDKGENFSLNGSLEIDISCPMDFAADSDSRESGELSSSSEESQGDNEKDSLQEKPETSNQNYTKSSKLFSTESTPKPGTSGQSFKDLREKLSRRRHRSPDVRSHGRSYDNHQRSKHKDFSERSQFKSKDLNRSEERRDSEMKSTGRDSLNRSMDGRDSHRKDGTDYKENRSNRTSRSYVKDRKETYSRRETSNKESDRGRQIRSNERSPGHPRESRSHRDEERRKGQTAADKGNKETNHGRQIKSNEKSPDHPKESRSHRVENRRKGQTIVDKGNKERDCGRQIRTSERSPANTRDNRRDRPSSKQDRHGKERGNYRNRERTDLSKKAGTSSDSRSAIGIKDQESERSIKHQSVKSNKLGSSADDREKVKTRDRKDDHGRSRIPTERYGESSTTGTYESKEKAERMQNRGKSKESQVSADRSSSREALEKCGRRSSERKHTDSLYREEHSARKIKGEEIDLQQGVEIRNLNRKDEEFRVKERRKYDSRPRSDIRHKGREKVSGQKRSRSRERRTTRDVCDRNRSRSTDKVDSPVTKGSAKKQSTSRDRKQRLGIRERKRSRSKEKETEVKIERDRTERSHSRDSRKEGGDERESREKGPLKKDVNKTFKTERLKIGRKRSRSKEFALKSDKKDNVEKRSRDRKTSQGVRVNLSWIKDGRESSVESVKCSVRAQSRDREKNVDDPNIWSKCKDGEKTDKHGRIKMEKQLDKKEWESFRRDRRMGRDRQDARERDKKELGKHRIDQTNDARTLNQDSAGNRRGKDLEGKETGSVKESYRDKDRKEHDRVTGGGKRKDSSDRSAIGKKTDKITRTNRPTSSERDEGKLRMVSSEITSHKKEPLVTHEGRRNIQRRQTKRTAKTFKNNNSQKITKERDGKLSSHGKESIQTEGVCPASVDADGEVLGRHVNQLFIRGDNVVMIALIQPKQ